MRSEATYEGGPGAPSLIRWGAVFAGVILGLSTLLLLSSLWAAIGYGANVPGVASNLAWFVAGSAVFAMLLGGFFAGWLSGIPAGKPGLFNGLAVWGLILIGSIVLGAPGALGAFSIDPSLNVNPNQIGSATLWAPFLTLLVGAIAAGIGGLIGGKTTRPAAYYAAGMSHDHGDSHTERQDHGTEHREHRTINIGNDDTREGHRSDDHDDVTGRQLAYTRPRQPDNDS